MKNQSLVIVIVTMLFMHNYSHAETIDAFKGQIYEALKDNKNIGPHIPKIAKEQRNANLQILARPVFALKKQIKTR